MNALLRGKRCDVLEVGAESIDIRNEQCKWSNRLCSLVCFSRTRSEEKQDSSTFSLKQA